MYIFGASILFSCFCSCFFPVSCTALQMTGWIETKQWVQKNILTQLILNIWWSELRNVCVSNMILYTYYIVNIFKGKVVLRSLNWRLSSFFTPQSSFFFRFFFLVVTYTFDIIQYGCFDAWFTELFWIYVCCRTDFFLLAF